MSACVSRTLGFCSSMKDQRIVSVLNSGYSDISSNMSAASLRRTLSAETSSKISLDQNQFCPVQNKEDEVIKEGEGQGRDLIDIWNSILSEKMEGNNEPLPPPYIHPLEKRSSSILSQKSLEMCTESLGSESGSDWFDNGDWEETKEQSTKTEPALEEIRVSTKTESANEEIRVSTKTGSANEEIRVSKCDNLCVKKLPPRSFPLPIPFLSAENGRSVRMNTRRDGGRIVLEAVSVPTKNNFFAKRDHGRLVLTIYKHNNADDKEEKADEESGMSYGNPTWAKSKKVQPQVPLTMNSLPPRPRMARPVAPSATVNDTVAAACFNDYESHWRQGNLVIPQNSKLNETHHMKNSKKHGGDGMVDSWLKSCKEQRRSLLFMEPFYIATS